VAETAIEHDEDRSSRASGHCVAERLQPEREERIRHAGDQGEQDDQDDHPWFVGVAQLAEPPHRAQRRRQLAGRIHPC
jgi:hypothetical protein